MASTACWLPARSAPVIGAAPRLSSSSASQQKTTTAVNASSKVSGAAAAAATAAPHLLRRRRRRGAYTTVVRAGYGDDIPDSPGGAGGQPGEASRLIMPGMDGFDANLVQTSRAGGGLGGGSSAVTMPGQFPGGYEAPPKPGSEKAAGEAFAPFRPPSQYLEGAALMDEDDQMSLLRLRQRAGNWYDLSPLFAKLMRSGFTTDDIFEETGIEPKEQSLWITWTASRGSLLTDPRFPKEKLAYFDDEYNGAPCLSHIQYLVAEKRSAAAEFVVDNQFNPDQTRELVKAFEMREAYQTQAKGFGTTPGECMAFKMWKDVQEVQRYQGMEAVVALVEKGRRYAEQETTVGRLLAMFEMWQMDLAEGSELNTGGSLAKAEAMARANINTVRLDAEEIAFKPIPHLGPMDRLTTSAASQVQQIITMGLFNVFQPAGAREFVALPAWAALGEAAAPFAVTVGNTGTLKGAGDLSQREEPALIVVDRAAVTPSPSFYYLCARYSSLLVGAGDRAEIVDIFPGRDVMDMERDGNCTVIGRVVLAVRAPGGMGDGLTTEFIA